MSLWSFIQSILGNKPAKPKPPQPPTSRWLSMDVHGPTEFTATLYPDLSTSIAGERLTPEAPWHISFKVPSTVNEGADIEIVPVDKEWAVTRCRLSVGGKTVDELGALPASDTECDAIEVTPNVPSVVLPQGIPIINRRVFQDNRGTFLGLAVSLFWATWGIMYDKSKLEQNLDVIKGKVDAIRVFGTVGPGGLWDQRTSSMQDVMSQNALSQLADGAYSRGIRILLTVFATKTGTRQDRDNFINYVGSVIQQNPEKFIFVEIANEGQNNGFEKDEIAAHAAKLRAMIPHNVALTAPTDGSNPVDYYNGTSANLMTLHLERDTNGTGGVWRPVRQPREGQATNWSWINNEPIGIGSSVAQDDDPLRLAMSAALTWLCQGALYVFHTGAGIYGLGYQGPTSYRYANLWEQPTFDAALNAMNNIKRILPSGLPNWTWLNGNKNYPAYPFEVDPLTKEDDVLRSFLATDGTNFVCMPIRVANNVPYIARRAMSFTHYDPLTGQAITTATLQVGERYTLPGAPNGQCAAIFIGQYL